MDRSEVWRPLRPQAISLREWDDEFVLYNDDTGSTHHLNSLGGEVLLALLRHPEGIGADALVRDVSSRVEPPPDVVLAVEIDRALAQLADLHLAAGR